MTEEWSDSINPFNSMKILCWPNHIKGILDNEFLPPVSVTVDPTNICNLSCMWCISEKVRSTDSLNKNELLDLVDFFKKWGVRSCCIAGGGEPFINKHTPLFIEKLKNSNIPIGIISNGSLIDKDIANVIVDNCDWIGISVDSGTREDYKLIKKVDVFDKVIDNISLLSSIKNLHNSKLDIGYKFLIHNFNYTHLYDAALIAKSIGCNTFHARPVYYKDEFSEDCIDFSLKELYKIRCNLEDDNFKVFSVQHKFDKTWKRKVFGKCISTPIATVFGADKNIHLCCDRRGDKDLILCKYFPLDNVIDNWNSKLHKKLLSSIDSSYCPRCTWGAYTELINKVFVEDKMTYKFV